MCKKNNTSKRLGNNFMMTFPPNNPADHALALQLFSEQWRKESHGINPLELMEWGKKYGVTPKMDPFEAVNIILDGLVTARRNSAQQMRKDRMIKTDNWLKAAREYPTREEQADHLGITKRHLQRLRADTKKELLQVARNYPTDKDQAAYLGITISELKRLRAELIR